MHSPLDEYLAQIKKFLRPLPNERREEEILELRQHLLSATYANQERGQSEREAAEQAVAQFGKAKDLSDKIVSAWFEERSRRRETAFSVMLALCMPLQGIHDPLNSFWSHVLRWLHASSQISTHGNHQFDIITVSIVTVDNAFLGALLGFTYPRRAVQAIGIGRLLLLCVNEFMVTTKPLSAHLDSLLLNALVMVFPAVLAAWTVSRTQIPHQGMTKMRRA